MLITALLTGALACMGDSNTAADITGTTSQPPLSSIVLTPDSATIEVGESLKLGTMLFDSRGQKITDSSEESETFWSISDTTVATISPAGLITGRRVGIVDVHVRNGRYTSRGRVRVNRRPSGPATPPAEKPPVTTPPPVVTPPAPPPPVAPPPVTPPPVTPTPPVTPPAPEAPPPTSSNSNGPGLSGKALMSDDFRNYSSTSAFLQKIQYPDGKVNSGGNFLYGYAINASLLEIDNSVRYNGHPTLKYVQPGGTARTPQLEIYMPNRSTLTHMWLRVKVRFSKGYTTYGVSPGANAYKVLGWGWAGSDGRATLEITNTNQYTFNWNVVGSKDNRNGPFVEKSNPHITTEWTDEGWYDYVVQYEQTSSTTIVQRWWLAKDGQRPQLKAEITGRMTSGTVPGLERVMLGMNFNSERPASNNQAIWYGQWEIVDGKAHPNPFGLL